MSAHKPTVALVDATEAKNRFGEVIKRAYEQEEHLIVRRSGLPVVAIIPIQDYEQLVSAAEQGAALSPAVAAGMRAAAARIRLRDFLDAAHADMPEMPAHKVEQDVERAVRVVRQSARRGSAKGASVTQRAAGGRAPRRR